MKLVVQHNWTSGLGDLYCACTEYLTFIKPLKKLGYETELIFCFNGFSKTNDYIGLNDFDKIFDKKSFKLFDKISVRDYPIGNLEYDGTKYYHTQYGPTTPGQHWWDIYFDIVPDNIIFPNYGPQSFLQYKFKSLTTPKFNNEVYKRVNKFKKKLSLNHNFIQIRHFDTKIPDNDFIKYIDELYSLLMDSQETYHLGSNSPYVNDKFSSLNNVFQYTFKNLELFSNDHPYYQYNKHISNEMLLDRLYDNIAEMVLVSKAKNIYQYSSFSWISNFLFYGFLNRKTELNFKIINNDLSFLK